VSSLQTYVDVSLDLGATASALIPGGGDVVAAALVGTKTLFDLFFPAGKSDQDPGAQINARIVANELQGAVDDIQNSMDWWSSAYSALSVERTPDRNSPDWTDPSSQLGKIVAGLNAVLAEDSKLWTAVEDLGDDARFREQALASFELGASHYLALMAKNIVLNAYRNEKMDPGLVQALVDRSGIWANAFNGTVTQMIQERMDLITPVISQDPPMSEGGQPEGSERYGFSDKHTGEGWSESSESEAEEKRADHIQKETDRFNKNHVDAYRPPVQKWLDNAADWKKLLHPSS